MEGADRRSGSLFRRSIQPREYGHTQHFDISRRCFMPVNVTLDLNTHILDTLGPPPPTKAFRFNPDAKTFVPTKLNPYAREFTPKNPSVYSLVPERNMRFKRSCSTNCSSEDEDSSSAYSVSTAEIRDVHKEKEPIKNSGPSDNHFCGIKICSIGSDDDISESEGEYKDEDWDEIEFDSPSSPLAWTNIPKEFQNNFGLMCQISPPPPSSSIEKKETTLSDDEDEEEANRKEELTNRLELVNKKWSQHYLDTFSPEEPSNNSSLKKNVSFSTQSAWTFIDEDPELFEELRDYRVDDLLKRKANLERLERIISPILSEDHRAKVYRKIYNEELL